MSSLVWQEDPPVPGKFDGTYWWYKREGEKPKLGRIGGDNFWEMGTPEIPVPLWYATDVKWAGPVPLPLSPEEAKEKAEGRLVDTVLWNTLQQQLFEYSRAEKDLKRKLADKEAEISQLKKEMASFMEGGDETYLGG